MHTLERSRASVVLCVFAHTLATQTPTAPVLEWGPGLAARNDLFLTQSTRLAPIAVDVDRDGDLDFVQQEAWNASGLLTVLENNGNGILVPRIYPPASASMWFCLGIAAGDIDGDLDVDVVFAGLWDGSGGADRPWVYLNDGTGNFTLDRTRFPRAPSARTGAVLADVDRDGDLDVVFTGRTVFALVGTVELWLNDGRGFFTEVTATHIPPGTDCESNAAAGDIDGDGFPELVIGRGNNGLTSKRILWNDGAGRFSVQNLPPNNSAYYCYLFDVDADGDLDVLFKGGQSMLFLNEPQGLRQVLVPNRCQPRPTTRRRSAT
jgi:hypothetical protein